MDNSLKKIIFRILEISYKTKSSHVGSNLTCAPILYDIYEKKKCDDIVILSCGHANLSLLCTLEHYGIIDNAEFEFKKMGCHPKRDLNKGIFVSSGSLGQAVTIAAGFAHVYKNSTRKIYCVSSDGEAIGEGSLIEALQFVYSSGLNNFHLYINANGFSALNQVDIAFLRKKVQLYFRNPENCEIYNHRYDPVFAILPDLIAHYKVLDQNEYEKLLLSYAEL